MGLILYRKITMSNKSESKTKGLVLGRGITGGVKVAFTDPETGKRYKCRYYKIWHCMITRCFSEKDRVRKPHQRDVTCCEEWLYFPNFKKWVLDYEAKYGSTEGLVLDKDIPAMSNREYHPSKCCFITRELNSIFSGTGKSKNNRTGVYEHLLPDGRKKYQAYININNRKKSLGYYHTPIEAHKAWQLSMIDKLSKTIEEVNCDLVIKGLQIRVNILKDDYENSRFTGKL